MEGLGNLAEAERLVAYIVTLHQQWGVKSEHYVLMSNIILGHLPQVNCQIQEF